MTSLLFVLVFYYQQILLGNVSPNIIKDFIATEATISGVSPQLAIGVAEAESQFNPQAVGDHGTSFGLYQIHLPAHPDISKTQAENIIFSTEWSIREMRDNSCTIWSTCEQVKSSLGTPQTLTDGRLVD